jgi:hypothetical protein
MSNFRIAWLNHTRLDFTVKPPIIGFSKSIEELFGKRKNNEAILEPHPSMRGCIDTLSDREGFIFCNKKFYAGLDYVGK